MIAKQLKELRARDKITQEALAEALSVERSSIGKYESPTKPVTPPPDVLLRIADYFHVSTDYLLGRTGKKVPVPKSGDGLSDMEQQLIQYVRDLNPDQQQMLLAQMQVMKEAQKGAPPSAAQK